MSKSSRKNKAERRLASKMGNYLTYSSKSKKGVSGYNKPGTKQIK
jgi:hypothetical protein